MAVAVFRSGLAPSFASAPLVSWPPMIFFAKITQIFDFFAFLNFTKAAKFATYIKRPKTKSASASGGLRPPDLLTSVRASGPRWGLCTQTPVIGSCYRARHRTGARAPPPNIAG